MGTDGPYILLQLGTAMGKQTGSLNIRMILVEISTGSAFRCEKLCRSDNREQSFTLTAVGKLKISGGNLFSHSDS